MQGRFQRRHACQLRRQRHRLAVQVFGRHARVDQDAPHLLRVRLRAQEGRSLQRQHGIGGDVLAARGGKAYRAQLPAHTVSTAISQCCWRR
jgi:hypothetical protein